MIIRSSQPITNLQELKRAVDEVVNLAYASPETIYVHDTATLQVLEHTLTDGSKVYDIRIIA